MIIDNFPPAWQELWQELAFEATTEIQEELFEEVAAGENILGISPTGSGKTLAYLWPSLLKVQKGKAQQLLILAPNSELAGQIFDVTKVWAEPLGLKAQVFLSGSSQKRQIERLKKGPEILIGTPGRIFELVKLKKIKMMNWQPFHLAPQTAHHAHVASMQSLVQLTTQNEQTRSGQAVRDHLNHRPLVRQLAAGVDGNQHEAHV